MADSPLKSDFQLPSGDNQAGINLQELLGSNLFQAKTIDAPQFQPQQAFQFPGEFRFLVEGGAGGDLPTAGAITPPNFSNLENLPEFVLEQPGFTPNVLDPTESIVANILSGKITSVSDADIESIIPSIQELIDSGIDINALGLDPELLTQIQDFLDAANLPVDIPPGFTATPSGELIATDTGTITQQPQLPITLPVPTSTRAPILLDENRLPPDVINQQLPPGFEFIDGVPTFTGRNSRLPTSEPNFQQPNIPEGLPISQLVTPGITPDIQPGITPTKIPTERRAIAGQDPRGQTGNLQQLTGRPIGLDALGGSARRRLFR